MKFISRDVMRLMPWKNGGGVTTEIAIEPDGSQIAANGFRWRLSSASVETSGPFSVFENYDRVLMVWRGSGLELNGRVLAAFVPFFFQGEEPIYCRPLDAKVEDIGVVFQRGKFEVDMQVLSHEQVERFFENPEMKTTYFLFDPSSGNAWRSVFGTKTGPVPRPSHNNLILIRIKETS